MGFGTPNKDRVSKGSVVTVRKNPSVQFQKSIQVVGMLFTKFMLITNLMKDKMVTVRHPFFL